MDVFDYVCEGQMSIFDLNTEVFKITKPIRLIELFAGVGSQAMALRDLGADFEHYRVVEFDKYAIASYNAIHGTEFPTMDITKVSGADLGIVDTYKYCYLMTYSFPCQDLSVAGLGKGMTKGSGTRSGLLWEVERLLNEVDNLPQVLLMENVPQVHGKKNMDDFQRWIQFLESKGYSNFWQDLNAKNYGVAQNRNRCFMVSILGNYRYEFPKPIALTKTMKDYLEDEVDDRYYISNSKADALIQKLIDNGTLNGRKTELWLPIKGYEEYYEVSNYGNVRALQREISTSDGKIRKLDGVDLKPIMNKTGYFTVNLCKDGEHKIHYIHRLVAECFVENPLCKDTVNHKDGNKTNNYFENLEWLTRGENMEHAWRTGLCHSSELTGGVRSVAKVDAETGEVLEVYPSIAEAARINKHASASGISSVLSGQKITSHGFKWEYVDTLISNGTIPRAEQSRAEQSRAEQSRAEQSRLALTLPSTSQEESKRQTALRLEQTEESAITDKKVAELLSVNELGFIENGTGKHQSNTVYGTDGICPCEYSVQHKEPFKILE